MLKIMIIKYQKFAKTNTFSLSFHILFSRDTSKSGFGDERKWEKMGLPPPRHAHYASATPLSITFIMLHNKLI